MNDPGFLESRASGFAISLFEWTFSVDSPTQYSLNATLTSKIFLSDIFSPSASINGLIASSYELKDISSGAIIHDDIAIDTVPDETEVNRTSIHQGTLPAGTYQLTAIADGVADVFEDAVTGGVTTYQVDLTLTTVPEPSAALLSTTAILVVAILGRRKRRGAK